MAQSVNEQLYISVGLWVCMSFMRAHLKALLHDISGASVCILQYRRYAYAVVISRCLVHKFTKYQCICVCVSIKWIPSSPRLCEEHIAGPLTSEVKNIYNLLHWESYILIITYTKICKNLLSVSAVSDAVSATGSPPCACFTAGVLGVHQCVLVCKV